MTFAEFKFKDYINQAIKALNFNTPTKIQQEIIPLMLQGKSVVGQAVTGSGKSHAFILPIFERMNESTGKAQVIITSPTRELAKQLYDMVQQVNECRPEPYKVKLYVGGRDREKELTWLLRQQPDIVIGTPGRIWDLAIKERKLLIHEAKILVIDEADMTFDAGFLEQVDQIAGTMPKDLQMAVFSATIPEKLTPFLKKYLENPIIIDLTKHQPTPNRLTHYLLKAKHRDKNLLLLKIMEAINPYLAIIFTNTKQEAIQVAEFLRSKDRSVGEIHGDLSSRERARMMREIRDLRYTYVVATDIAARGIDLEGVSHVINYSLPQDYEFYIHRSGRTSRQNLDGLVISLYEFEDEAYLKKLEAKQIKFKYIEIKNREIVEAKPRNYRQKFVTEMKGKNNKVVVKPKKVKPGYKKKMKQGK